MTSSMRKTNTATLKEIKMEVNRITTTGGHKRNA